MVFAAVRSAAGRSSLRTFSTTASRKGYKDTIKNLNIGKKTKVIYQGFTGKQATINAQQSIAWGTNILGGVTPGRSSTHLDLPVFPNVQAAVDAVKPDATAVFVAAPFAAAAIEEAIAAEIPLIVAVAEHVPLHDMYRVHSILATQSKTRLVGANCPGIISPLGRCRVGFMPHMSFAPGSVGIVAKSGTLSYEAVASTARAGLGQSLVVGSGGDPLPGTTLRDAVELMWEDPATEGIIVIGEMGGPAEMEVVEFLEEKKGKSRWKPVLGLVTGKTAPEGVVMGHAGAFVSPGDPTVEEKVRALERVGVEMVLHPGEFGEKMARALGRKLPAAELRPSGGFTHQKRSFSTFRRPSMAFSRGQSRGYHLDTITSENVLSGLAISSEPLPSGLPLKLTISRPHKSPILHLGSESLPLNYLLNPTPSDIVNLRNALSLPVPLSDFTAFLTTLYTAYKSAHLQTLSATLDSESLTLHNPLLTPDPSSPLYPSRAHPLGIVYHLLPPPPPGTPRIGTLVNGAGLAMNTLDALVAYGGHPANFLDTGGKATEETVVGSLRLLVDEGVNVVFVNIFGGLTRGAVIARGVVEGVKRVRGEGWKGAVVVRIRGTEEEEGQEVVRESGLVDVFSFDGLEEAARKAIELARERM